MRCYRGLSSGARSWADEAHSALSDRVLPLAPVDLHRWECQCHNDKPMLYQISSNIPLECCSRFRIISCCQNIVTIGFRIVAALLQGRLCNAVVSACDDAAMRVCSYWKVTASYTTTTWQTGHTTLHSHAVRARDRPSSDTNL